MLFCIGYAIVAAYTASLLLTPPTAEPRSDLLAFLEDRHISTRRSIRTGGRRHTDTR